MTLGRRLAEGIGAWLMFEFSCDRSGLFNEKYLSPPIGQILSSKYGDRVISEYQHGPLSDLMTGKGRRPEIDFAICDPYPDVKVAIESKWVGKSKPSIDRIIWDLIRLEMLAHKYGAECYFVLGGKKASVDAFLADKKFTGPNQLESEGVLNSKRNHVHYLKLTPDVRYRNRTMKKIFERYQDTKFPLKIKTVRHTPFPENPNKAQYQVIVWRIESLGRDKHFRPRNSLYYAS